MVQIIDKVASNFFENFLTSFFFVCPENSVRLAAQLKSAILGTSLFTQ